MTPLDLIKKAWNEASINDDDIVLRARRRVVEDDCVTADANGLWPRIADGVVHKRSGAPKPHEVEICRSYIRLYCRPTYHPQCYGHRSYGMKHVVERWTAGNSGEDRGVRGHTPLVMDAHKWPAPYEHSRYPSYDYVSNGAFIEAAAREGYRIYPNHVGSINCHFDMIDTSLLEPTAVGSSPFVLFLYSLRNEGGIMGMFAEDVWYDADFPRAGDPDAVRQYLAEVAWDSSFVSSLETAIARWETR